jgi:hypothetical protein
VLVVSTTLFFDDHDIIATKKTVAAAKSGDYRCICCRSGTYDSLFAIAVFFAFFRETRTLISEKQRKIQKTKFKNSEKTAHKLR